VLRCRRITSSAISLSGHSRWSKIKHDKGGVDRKKAKERNIMVNDIMQASKGACIGDI
jgi:transcriptional/translational regulatory protein YebC/TACO1